jgi:hypothetical protein
VDREQPDRVRVALLDHRRLGLARLLFGQVA